MIIKFKIWKDRKSVNTGDYPNQGFIDSGVPFEFVFSSKKIYEANENRNFSNSLTNEVNNQQ
jgi:hypothetical protein